MTCPRCEGFCVWESEITPGGMALTEARCVNCGYRDVTTLVVYRDRPDRLEATPQTKVRQTKARRKTATRKTATRRKPQRERTYAISI